MHDIEFSLVPMVEANADWFPKPYPANKDVPEWFRTMPTEVEAPRTAIRRTVKNCTPFVEALTCGYIIPLAADIKVGRDASGAFFGESRDVEIVHFHPANQVKGAPFEHLPIVKILNPWMIRTPPGFSTLFLPPLNRFHMPLIPLSGLVETDNFYREVNFPALLTVQPGTHIELAKGTPIVQVIPIRRDEFQSIFTRTDAEKYDAIDRHTRPSPENQSYYKNTAWVKKVYH